MSEQLFRKEVVAQSSSQWLGVVRLATPISHRIWTVTALGVAVSIIAWLFLGSYTRREHVTGMLVPQAGLMNVSSPSAATVGSVLVSEGDQVRAGQPLVTLSAERASETLGDMGRTISEQLHQQKAALETDISQTGQLSSQQAGDLRAQLAKLEGQVHQVDEQIALARKEVQMDEELLNKVTPLLDKGYIPLFQVQQERGSLLSSQSQIKSLRQQKLAVEQQVVSLRDQLAQLPVSTVVKVNELRRQSAQVEQTLAQNEVGRASVLKAPQDGVVSSLLVRTGQGLTPGQLTMSIMPNDSPLQAQLFMPSRSAGFVHPGANVVLHYQAFPYQKFGLQFGTVRAVSASALAPTEVASILGAPTPPTEPQYRVLVNLPAQAMSVYGEQERLKPGMAVDGDVLLDRRRIVEWIFEPLFAAGRRLGDNAP